ncbi:MAG TPA: hypothetical protein VK031_02205 [Tissierellaceae bacterium]|nr:hypothetical protein [Tissierellaceae bacterium]
MITAKDCKNCGEDKLKALLCKISRELSIISKKRYNNDRFNLGRDIDERRFKALLNYKNILYKKAFDSTYTGANTNYIISKIKSYIYAR